MKKKLFLVAAAAALGLEAHAQSYTHAPVPVTGFTADVIADGTGPAANSTSTDIDGEGYNLVAQNFVNPSNQSPTSYLPTGGLINSFATPGLMFQMEPYNANNSLRLNNATNSGTLTLTTPRAADIINLMVTSAYGSTFSAFVSFTDGTTQIFAGNVVPNWFDGTTANAARGVSRVIRATNVIENSTTNPRLYQYALPISAANAGKLIQSITFTRTTSGAKEVMHVFAVTASTLLPNDIGVSSITAPTGLLTPGVSQPVTVTVKNYGSAALNTATLGFSVNGTTVLNNYAFTASPALANNGVSAPVTIGNFTFPQGVHKVKAWTKLPNGVADGAAANDTMEVNVTACNPFSGNYTIDRNSPASSTNFTSLAAAQALLNSCGVTGPTTFTVAPNSGPYNEQIVLGQITGASATNTITFEGNGNTILFAPGATHQGVVTLNGADYVKINNFTIGLAAGATTGWGVQLKSNADYNIISNNTLNLPLSSTSSSVHGIVFGTNYSTAGANGSNNLVQNNIINGGFAGIAVNGNGGNVGAVANLIKNNQVRDSYNYAIYLQNVTNNIIEGNDISRPARTNGTHLYGIYLAGTSIGNQIRKNRVHNGHDVATTSTTLYSYYTIAAGGVGAENVYSNNMAYNSNNPGNTFYGFYNSGGNNTWYFHNTVLADNPALNYFTVRGMWFATAATNVKFINNNISIVSTATNKHLIYLTSSSIALVCNNNNLYKGTSGNIGFYSSDKATMTEWKAVNSNAYDQNSVSANPYCTNSATGNLQPKSAHLDNVGQVITDVTDDITGTARHATTPDIGAYEFNSGPDDTGVSAITTLASACGLTNQETVTVTLNNYGTSTLSNIPVSFAVNGGTPVTETFAGPLAPGANANYTFTAKADLSVPNTYTISSQTGYTTDGIADNNASSKEITSIPVVTTYPYNQNFETYNGGWLPGGTNSTWAWGTPAKSIINSAASGTKAYVTNLTGNYSANEKSQVVGPCFNFSSLVVPVFEAKIWWNSDFSNDGAVLQSSIDGGATWQNVGVKGDPNNWYNDNTIGGAPGGQPAATAEGWTGRNSTSNGSGGWVTAKHALTGLGGQSAVRLRIAFGSDASTHDQGFAFDDVMIYEAPISDAGVTAISSPATGCNLTNQETITITVKNFGTSPISNVPVSYTINGGTAVSETFAGPLAPGATDTYSFTTKANLSVAGSYTIEATTNLTGDALATNNTTTKVVVSSAPAAVPTITAGGSTSICNGGSVTLTAASATTGATYTWYKDGTAITGATAATYSANAAGSYTAVATANGCPSAASAATTVMVNTAAATPTVSAGGATTFCTGGSVVLTAASATTGATYQWFNNGTAITAATNATYTANTAGSYTVVATANGCPSAASTATNVTVNAPTATPTVTAGGPTALCTGGSVTLTAASATTGATYAWYRNGTAITGATSATYVANIAGAYYAVATANGCPSAASAATTVSIGAAAAVPTITAGGPLAICSGGSVTLTAASATTGATYQWFNNGTVITGATGATYAANAAGSYTAVASANGCPSAASTATIVTLNTPAATPTITAGGTTTFCSGSSVVLTAASATAGATYQWFNNGTAIAAATSATYTANATGSYTVVATAAGCPSVASAATTVTVNATPATPTVTQNGGTLTSSSVTGNQWFKDGIIIPGAITATYNVSSNGCYTVQVTSNGCTSTASNSVCITNTGVKEDAANFSLSVFPNPGNGNFNVSLEKGRVYDLKITDLTGKVILTQTAKGNTKLNLPGAAKGIYLLQVSSENGTAIRKLIVE